MPAIMMLDGFAPPQLDNAQQVTWQVSRANEGNPILNGEMFYDVETNLLTARLNNVWKPLRSDIDLTGTYVSGTLPVAKGGTGGDDEASALLALGAAAAAHTHTIDDIEDLPAELYEIMQGDGVLIVKDDTLRTATVSVDVDSLAILPIQDTDVAVDTTGMVYYGDGVTPITQLDVLVADINDKIGLRVPYGAYDPHTVIIAIADNTPIPLTITPGTVLGRAASGNITALTSVQQRANAGIDNHELIVVNTSGNVSMPTPVYTNGISTKGHYAGQGFRVTQNIGVMTHDVDPVDPSIGTPYLFTYNFTAHAGDTIGIGATGPQVMSGYRGPRAAFAFEGVGFWPENMRVYSPEPMAYMDAHTERLPASAGGDRFGQFSWSFLHARYRFADGHKWTVRNNDTRSGPVPFFDNQVWVSGNGGEIDGTTYTATPRYPIGDNYSEHDVEPGAWLASFSGGPHFYGNVAFTGYAMFAGHDANTELNNPTGPTWIELGETSISGAITIDASTTYPLLTQMMFFSPRLKAGARNLAGLFNSTLAFWEDDYTWDSTDPLFHIPEPVIRIGAGTKTLDWTNPSISAFSIGGTWIFNQPASALGAFTAFSAQPTISNKNTISGDVIPLSVMHAISPKYSMRTNAGDVNLVDLRGYYSRPEFTILSGTNDLTIGAYSGFQSQLLINNGTGATGMVARYGFYFADATGTGTITNQTAIFIEALAKGGINFGFVNNSWTLAQGGLAGSGAANGVLNIYGTGHATRTNSYIALNDRAIALGGLYGSIANNGNLSIGGTSSATHTTSVITLLDDVTLSKALTVTGNAAVTGNTALTGTLAVTGDTSLTGSLFTARTRPDLALAFERYRYPQFYEEFWGTNTTSGQIGAHGWISVTANGGAVASLGSGFGVYTVGTGTTTPSGATGALIALANASAGALIEIGVDFDYEWGVALPSLSTAGEEYDAWIGWGNSTTVAEPTAGYWFKYDRNTSVNWITCIGDGTATTSTTTSTAVTNASNRLRVERVGTTVTFYVNDVQISQHVADANLPDALADTYWPLYAINKSAGVTQRFIRGDFHKFIIKSAR